MASKKVRKERFKHIMSSHSQVLQIQSRAIERLIPYARNARTNSDAQIVQIAAGMAEFGLNNPVLIDPDGGNIANHGSVLAARTLAYTDVPVPSTSHVASSEQTSKQRLGGRNNGRF
jgi:hypothetical protein